METAVWLMRTGKSACDKEDEQSRVAQAMALFRFSSMRTKRKYQTCARSVFGKFT